LALLALSALGYTQTKSKTFKLNQDTIWLDTLSISPSSIQLQGIDKQSIYIDYINAYLAIPKSAQTNQEASIKYKTLPFKLNKEAFHKDVRLIQPEEKEIKNPFEYTIAKPSEAPWELTGLSKSGSLSRGISFGNNQNLSVNSNLNLQLSGKITDNVSVLAAISDENIPIQPEGNTKQLQDFDQVYIQVFDDKSKLTAGDFTLGKPDSYFMKYFKRAQGGSFETSFKTNSKTEVDVQASAAISRGKFGRNIIQGVEGNQGPYRLRGTENEQFIVVLSGTERVYIDGNLLVRGQENDYTINYNTAELVFTAKQLITKDKRIIVEFQYSVLNYQRSLFQFSNSVKQEKWQLNFNAYSEQDNKNQPIQQDLDEEDRTLLANIGDSLNLAIIPAIDTANFNDNLVLYALTDTLINGFYYDSIFVFSQSQEVQLYKLSFSEVGFGNGNYVISNSLANGRVYKWSAPDAVSGLPTGNFEPIILIETPKQQQMFTLGGKGDFGNNKVNIEAAVSNNDLNTFSKFGNNNNYGSAFKGEWQNKSDLGKSKNNWKLKTGAGFEFWNRNFREIERIRSVEFYRDWNLRDVQLTKDQKITTGFVGFENGQKFDLVLKTEYFDVNTDFKGLKNNVGIKTNTRGLKIDFNGYLLNSQTEKQTNAFYRHKTLASQAIGKFVVGYRDDFENNLRRDALTDTLNNNGYRFYEYEYFVTNPDTAKNRYKINYVQRRDFNASQNQLVLSTLGEAYGFSFDLMKNPNAILRGKTTYRTLLIKDSTLTNNKPDNSLVNRLEYQVRLLKGAITSNSFYEVSSGLESKKEFTYIEVQAGQGTYTWNDYNDNGIKELDEFEISIFQDQAAYIRVFFPTDDYVKTFSNQFSQNLFINPAAVWGSKKGIKKFVSRFSNQMAFRTDRKTTDQDFATQLNPFVQTYQIADTNLLSTNNSLRNSTYFNRTARVFGAEFTWQDVTGKTLLTNGFESRTNENYSAKARLNLTNILTLNGLYMWGQKTNLSDYFNRRDYTINYLETEPKISLQPSSNFRVSLLFNYKEKHNILAKKFDTFGEFISGGEKSFFRTLGTEFRTASLDKGNLTAGLNWVNINFDGGANSPVSFEMLEGLQNGQNLTWNVYYQRTLANNLQIDLNYSGRANQSAKTVHTGGVQVRAFF